MLLSDVVSVSVSGWAGFNRALVAGLVMAREGGVSSLMSTSRAAMSDATPSPSSACARICSTAPATSVDGTATTTDCVAPLDRFVTKLNAPRPMTVTLVMV